MGTAPGSGPDWLNPCGKTLAQVMAVALRASVVRHNGNRRLMMHELGISKSTLLRKLDELGLRGRDPTESG
jgi:DNA-binding NtrC family response regulator